MGLVCFFVVSSAFKPLLQSLPLMYLIGNISLFYQCFAPFIISIVGLLWLIVQLPCESCDLLC